MKEAKGRTNNSQDCWHKLFAFDAKVHPTLNKLIENFRLEQNLTEVFVAQIQSGTFLLNHLN